jgi:hypothetical protein
MTYLGIAMFPLALALIVLSVTRRDHKRRDGE